MISMMSRSLVIGFGNISRADDSAAWHIINSLRRKMGREALSEEDTGLEELGLSTDTIFVSQLPPELIDVLIDYERVIFVDAHIDACLDNLHCDPVEPHSAPPAFSHHTTPAMILALLEAIHSRTPVGWLVSVRGYDFDFRPDLSPQTLSLIEPATQKILELIATNQK
jgi:hydrogenase maturation protease